MQKDEIDKCTALAKEYHTNHSEQTRNNLYTHLQPHMVRWMKAIFAEKKVFWEKGDLLSESWLCFEFCLRHFKVGGNIPLPNHFYSYSKFYIATICNEHIKKDIFKTEYSDDFSRLARREEDFDSVYEQLDELRCFKEGLPEEYHSIFDDAVMSMVGCLNDRVRRLDETPVKYYRYCESKKIFRIVISYLLRR